ncbi:hypothetical protein J6R97_04180 [bacterium]|nr:hypothetical protein [bacterium]
MVNPVNYSKQMDPSYSGVTINISNPMVNPAGNHVCDSNCNAGCYTQPTHHYPNNSYNQNVANSYGVMPPQAQAPVVMPPVQSQQQLFDNKQQAYPPQYYLNNYNYVQNPEPVKPQFSSVSESSNMVNEQPPVEATPMVVNREPDLSSSKEIIKDLDNEVAKQKDLVENGQQKKIVALTNEYIMSLENCLNNPNAEIRLRAAKDILIRLDEDKERHNDAALNALLNKMLQDPDKLIRIAALSAFSSRLASGNDFTVELLQNIQNNPNSEKEDVVEATNILLQMSADTEIRYEKAKPAQAT